VRELAARRRLRFDVTGRADHAGTTPMDARDDALAKAARMIAAATEPHDGIRATATRILCEPNALSTIPSHVTFWLDIRGVGSGPHIPHGGVDTLQTMPNVFEPEFEHEAEAPFSLRAARVGAAAGAQRLGATLYEIDPGGAVSPYHVHHANEEMLIVLDGAPSLRTPDGVRELERGDVIVFPAGPDGAHRVFNESDAPARVLMVSTMVFPEVAEHLDTGSVLAMTAPGQGKVFPHGTDVPVLDALVRGMQIGTDRDRGQ
jgi:uncharacterized cupin superfamily protein